MEGCGKCMKYLMFIFNFLFFLCGAALLGVGIWVRVDGSSFMDLVGSNAVIFNSVYILIAAGAALLVISFLGCCGAMKENKCLLGTFFAIVLIIFIVEIVGGVLAFVYLPQARTVVTNTIQAYDPFNNNTDASVVLITQAWNAIQPVVGCCGFNSSFDWMENQFFPLESGARFPRSCCRRETFTPEGAVVNQTACEQAVDGFFYSQGCEEQFQNYFWVIGGVGLGILAIELLAMIFACCLYRSIDKDY